MTTENTVSNIEPSAAVVRIAVATSTGERVDQHFSRSQNFDIYDLTNSTWRFVERRANAAASCGCHEPDSGEAFDAVTVFIADCRFVIALRIGNGALTYLIDRGIRAAQMDDTVENAIRALVTSGKLNNLLRKHDRK